jgi:hypothetical protein
MNYPPGLSSRKPHWIRGTAGARRRLRSVHAPFAAERRGDAAHDPTVSYSDIEAVADQVEHARLHADPLAFGQPVPAGLCGEGGGDLPGPADQHRQRLGGHPVFGGRVVPGVEAPGGGPQVLARARGRGRGRGGRLLPGGRPRFRSARSGGGPRRSAPPRCARAGSQASAWPKTAAMTSPASRATEPVSHFAFGVRAAPHFALAPAPAGHGDHIVRPARRRGRAAGAGQGGQRRTFAAPGG